MNGPSSSSHGAPHASRALVLCDGDLPSYHAAWAARERAISDGPTPTSNGPALMPLLAPFAIDPPHASLPEPMEHAVTLQARALGLTCIAPITTHLPHAHTEDLPGQAESLALINAAYAAVRLGCDRVIYPVHACIGESIDLDRMAAIADRAVLAARLCSLDARGHHTPGIRIETPYVDLTDLQLADLFLDADLSPQALWWWGGSAVEGGGGAAGGGVVPDLARIARARWMRALEPMGFRV